MRVGKVRPLSSRGPPNKMQDIERTKRLFRKFGILFFFCTAVEARHGQLPANSIHKVKTLSYSRCRLLQNSQAQHDRMSSLIPVIMAARERLSSARACMLCDSPTRFGHVTRSLFTGCRGLWKSKRHKKLAPCPSPAPGGSDAIAALIVILFSRMRKARTPAFDRRPHLRGLFDRDPVMGVEHLGPAVVQSFAEPSL